MILLTGAKIPNGLDKQILGETVRLLFPHEKNREYIGNIEKRADLPAIESLFALALLYELIRSLEARIDTAELIFARSEMGKPYFEGSPVKFNISHSKGYVAVAVSLGEELGVDVEATDLPPERAIKLAERYFAREDLVAVSRDASRFAKIWSEKEAQAKFFGESVGNLFSCEKKEDFFANPRDVRLHRFAIDGHPVTLCTKRDFSTIVYTVQ